jgi:hypothetical protein
MNDVAVNLFNGGKGLLRDTSNVLIPAHLFAPKAWGSVEVGGRIKCIVRGRVTRSTKAPV